MNTATRAQRDTVSDDQGAYALTLLPVGVYDLEISFPGFLAYRRAGVVIGVKRELERIPCEIQKLIQAIKDGMYSPALKAEMIALEKRQQALLKQVEIAHEPEPLLHPSIADLYRAKVEQLAEAAWAAD